MFYIQIDLIINFRDKKKKLCGFWSKTCDAKTCFTKKMNFKRKKGEGRFCLV